MNRPGERAAWREYAAKVDVAIEKLTTTIAGLSGQIVALLEREKVREDHEKRIRALEVQGARTAVIVGIAAVIASAIVSRLMH